MKSLEFSKQNYQNLLKVLTFSCRNQIYYDEYVLSDYFDENKVNFNYLKTYKEWNELGYRIKQGSHGIVIDYKTLFDISQVNKTNENAEEPTLLTLNYKYFIDKNSEFNDFLMRFDFDKYYNDFKESSDNIDIDSNVFKSLVLYCFYDLHRFFDKNNDLKEKYENYFSKNIDKINKIYEKQEYYVNNWLSIINAVKDLDEYVNENSLKKVEEDKEKYKDLYVRKKLIKTLDKGSTMYYYIDSDKNQYINMEVQNELFNRRNTELSNNESNRVNSRNGRVENDEYLFNGTDGRNQEQYIFRAGEVANSGKSDGKDKNQIQSAQRNINEQRQRINSEISEQNNATNGRYRQGFEIRRNDRNIGQGIRQTVRTDSFIPNNSTGKRENKGNFELHGQGIIERNGQTLENDKQVEIPATVSENQRQFSTMQTFGHNEKNIDRTGENGLFERAERYLHESERATNNNDKSSSTARSDREFRSNNDIKNIYLDLKNLKDNEILINNEERLFIIDSINLYLQLNEEKNKEYNSFIEKLYDDLVNIEPIENRQRLPFKLSLDGINGNSISQNKQNLINIISFNLNRIVSNYNSEKQYNDNNIAYSVLKKLYLFNYNIKDKIDNNEYVKTYFNINNLIVDKLEKEYIEDILNNDKFIKDYGLLNDIYNEIKDFPFSQPNSWSYCLNLKDYNYFSNSKSIYFNRLINSYIKYLSERDNININELSIFDKEYINYKLILDIKNKLNNIIPEENINLEEINKEISYEEILNTDTNILKELKDSEKLEKICNIIFDNNADDLTNLFNNDKLFNILMTIKNNENLSNKEIYQKIDIIEANKKIHKTLELSNIKQDIEKLDDNEVEIITNDEFNLISDLDKKFEDYRFSNYDELNDYDKKFDKKLFYQMLDERKELVKYNIKISNSDDNNVNGFSKYVLCHFFGTAGDWYVLDYDKKEDLLYGFVELSNFPDGAEFGWFTLDELINQRKLLAPAIINGKECKMPCFLDLETRGIKGNVKLCEYYYKKDISNYFGIHITNNDLNYIKQKGEWRNKEYEKYKSQLKIESKQEINDNNIDLFSIEKDNNKSFVQQSFNFRDNGSLGFSSTEDNDLDNDDIIEDDLNNENDEIDKIEETATTNLSDKIKLDKIYNLPNQNIYNYQINNFDLKSISKSERFNNNCVAIELLQKIESENRLATADEMDILAKYSGWGGLNNYFKIEKCNINDYDRLKNLLTEEEYESCALSSVDSFYTPLNIINSIYQKLKQMGFKGGDILEPSCGIGNFFGVMPRDMFNNSNITGVELDRLSSRICQKLYPSVKVNNCGFEDYKNKNKFDLIIGNVPFGESSPYDPIYNKQKFKIHDYFINKSLALLKNGGICAIITSSGTLDKINKNARESFCQNANFLGGIRLPYGTFNLDGKGTDINSDILFFMKDNENAKKYQQEFINTNSLISYDENVIKNTESYIDKKTNERINFEEISLYDLDEDFISDMIAKQEIIHNNPDDNEVFTKKQLLDSRYIRFYVNIDKFNKLKNDYNNWVENGKVESDKPNFNNLEDKIFYDNYFDFNDDKFLENYDELSSYIIKNNNKNINFRLEDKRNLINYNNVYEQLKDFTINDYFKNNLNQVIGDLKTDTNQFGEVIVKNVINNDTFLNDLINCLNNIEGIYVKREEIKEDNKEKKQKVIFDNELYNQVALNITPYTYFIYQNQVCYKDFDTAFFIRNNNGGELKQEVVDRYKELINFRNCLTKIIDNENQGNYDTAGSLRIELNELYDNWLNNNKYKKNTNEVKKGDTIHFNDKEITDMLEDDRYIYLLQSVENCNTFDEFKYEKQELRKKGALRLEIDEDNDILEEDLDNVIDEIDIEVDNENIHLYKLSDNNYYDINGNHYKDTKTTYKIYDENNIKSDIFYRPIILNNTKDIYTNKPKEALIYSLQKKGCIDLNYMLHILNYKYNQEQLVNILKDDIVYDIVNSEYVLMDDFIAHNIKKKINDYKDIISKSNIELKLINYDIEHKENEDEKELLYQKRSILNEKLNTLNENLKILEEHKPVDIPFNAIDMSLGAKWIPTEIYTKFMKKEFLLDDYEANVIYNETTDDFYIPYIKNVDYSIDETIKLKYGLKYNNGKNTIRLSPTKLLLQALSLKPIRLTKIDHTEYDEHGKARDIYITDEKNTKIANSIIKTLKSDFVNFIKNDLNEEEKEKVVRVYNDRYNVFVQRDWTNKGQHIRFNGISNNIKLHPYQLDVINRAIIQGNTMFAHTVGAGKTFEMIATGMKFKELGLSNKNLYVVPKNLLPQWKVDFMKLFPNAFILVPNEKDFLKENRKKFLNKIALNNYDGIILSYEQFNKLSLSSSKQEQYINEDIKQAENTKNEVLKVATLNGLNTKDNIELKGVVRNIDKFIKVKEGILKRLLDKDKKDNEVIPFDELGIDKLFVDEAHNFKNAYFDTKLFNIKGITPLLTKRTYDMQLKCRYINETSNYKGVYLGTGTPVSNSIVELYTMMMYLRPDKLKEMNINSVDDFISTFSGISTDFEMDNTGSKLQLTTRIKQYTNLPELLNIMNESFDVINKNDLYEFSNGKIKLPKIHRYSVVLPETRISKSCQLTLVKRAKAIKEKKVKPYEDNMLLLTTDGKKISLYPQLYDENIPYDKINKIEAVVHYTTEIYNKYSDRLGTQLIFCDYGLPNSYKKDGTKNFDVYNAIKEKLISNGIKAKEIAFINDWDSPEKKNILSKKVNNGEIRVVIGGTQKLGTGMNVQKRCIAEHHLSVPYRPSDMEQREGRIIRQGNGNPNVYILNYTKKGSFDTRSYSILENKQKGISQLFDRKGVKNRSINGIEDNDDNINFVDLIACATNDNSLKEIMELEQEVQMLEATKSSLKAQLQKNADDIKKVLPNKIKDEQEMIKIYQTDCEYFNKVKDNFQLTVFGKEIGKTLGVFNSLKEFEENNGLSIFRERMKEIREKQIDQKVLLCEYKGFKIKGEYHAGEDFEIFFQSPNSNHEYSRYKFNDVRINRLEDWLAKDLPAYLNNHINMLDKYTKELESKKFAQNMSFDKENELQQKKDRLLELKQKNAEDPNALIKYDENGNIDEDSIDTEKLEEIMQKQAQNLEFVEKDFKYEEFEFINDKWEDPDLTKENEEIKKEDLIDIKKLYKEKENNKLSKKNDNKERSENVR